MNVFTFVCPWALKSVYTGRPLLPDEDRCTKNGKLGGWAGGSVQPVGVTILGVWVIGYVNPNELKSMSAGSGGLLIINCIKMNKLINKLIN
jgi:hypothetical protein